MGVGSLVQASNAFDLVAKIESLPLVSLRELLKIQNSHVETTRLAGIAKVCFPNELKVISQTLRALQTSQTYLTSSVLLELLVKYPSESGGISWVTYTGKIEKDLQGRPSINPS
jgi:hypothetical protein